MDAQIIHISETSGEHSVKDSLLENNGFMHHENNSQSGLLSGEGMAPQQLREAESCDRSHKQLDLDHSGNVDEIFTYSPSKKIKTEHKFQGGETVANNIENCLVYAQTDRESESKINEQESQQLSVGFAINRPTNLLPKDKNKNDGRKETVKSNDVYCNSIDCSPTDEKTKIHEAEEARGNKGPMKSKMTSAGIQEEILMHKTFQKLQDRELQDTEPALTSKEILINRTNRPAYDSSDVECPQKEIITIEGQNQKPQENEMTSFDEVSYGKNNYSATAKEINGTEFESGSRGNETASDESGTGKFVKGIDFLVIKEETHNVENEGNTKQISCKEFIPNNTSTDNQLNPQHAGNNEKPLDVTETPNEAHDKENVSLFPVEKGHGVDLADSAENKSEKNVHMIIYEHNKSWKALSQDEVFKLVDVPCDSAKYNEIKALFQNTTQRHFKLCKIVEVQNPFLYSCYLLKKAEMASRYGHIKEEYLFHGTKIKNVSSICETNLDWRKHGSGTGNIFGKGVSLSPISCYASHYSDQNLDEKIMFVFKVIIAHETEGNPTMVLPPYKDALKNLRYDTAIKPNRQVVVKFSDNEFYPEYLLYYTGEYSSKRYIDYFDDFDDSDSDDDFF